MKLTNAKSWLGTALGLCAGLFLTTGDRAPSGTPAPTSGYVVREFYQWTDALVDRVYFSRTHFDGAGKLVTDKMCWNLLMCKEVPDVKVGDIIEWSFVTTLSSYQFKANDGRMKSAYNPVFISISEKELKNTYDPFNAITTPGPAFGTIRYPGSGENTNQYRPHQRIWHHGLHRVAKTPVYVNAWASPSSEGAGPNDYMQVFKESGGNYTVLTVKSYRKF